MGIPDNIAAKVLVAAASTCCKCEERGRRIQIHHIDDDPSNDDEENLAVLCFECHNETQLTGGFGRRLSSSQVRLYRDQWIERVARRRQQVDAIFIHRATTLGIPTVSHTHHQSADNIDSNRSDIGRYIDDLPGVLAEACDREKRVKAENGSMLDMKRAKFEVVELVQNIWLRLAREFQKLHFDGKSPTEFMEQYVQQRYRWHYMLAEPTGSGSGGSIAGLSASSGVLRDLKIMVSDTVDSIRGLGQSQRERELWHKSWESLGARD